MQVQIFWQWFDFLCQQARTDKKQICVINLDETAVYRCALKARGYVSKNRCERTGRPPARFVNKSLKRGTTTHVSVITHMTEIQAMLPQFVLLNKRLFKATDLPHGESEGVQFWRDDTAWNTASKMIDILELIAYNLEAKLDKLQPVILLDMAPCHLDHQVIAAANRLGLWLLFVPAKLTYLLQPLDVAVLAHFKSELNAGFVASQDSTGTLRTHDWVHNVCTLGKTFWRGRAWKSAFHAVGLFGSQMNMTEELKCLGLRRTMQDPISLPKEALLQSLWPKHKVLPFKSLFWLPAKLDIVEID